MPHLKASDYHVIAIPHQLARECICRWHYSGGASNTSVYAHGLFPAGEILDHQCVGVAMWIPPTMGAAISIHPENPNGVLMLSRLAVQPGMPTNSASFLLGRSMRMIDRDRWPVLVTYADEMMGHKGTIYLATNWQESGMTKPERAYFRGGVMVSRKAGPRTRTHDEMLAMGCECRGVFSKRRFIHVASRVGDKKKMNAQHKEGKSHEYES